MPTDGRVLVPSAKAMAAMTDEEITALMADMRQAAANIEAKIRDAGDCWDVTGLRKALGYQRRGMLAADEILHRRFGSQTPYKPAQPVTDWITGFLAIKAMNRLLGLAKAEHEALTRWMSSSDETEPGDWRALCVAQADLARALAALPEVDNPDTADRAVTADR
jgi:hypothetical protein